MSIAENIKACESRLVNIADHLTAIRKSVEDDETRELTDEELDQIDALEEEQESVTKQLNGLRKMEDSLKVNAKLAAPSYAPLGDPAKTRKPGDLLIKMATAHFLAHERRKNIEQVLAEEYRHELDVHAAVRYVQPGWAYQKSITNDATTTTPGWAAELVASDIQSFLDLLAPESVYAQVAALGMQFSFDGNGTITIPRRNSTRRLSGAWVGEGGAIPVKQGSLGSTVLSPVKMGVISTFTKELERSSRPAIEQVIRAAMLADTAEELDAAFLSDSAAVAGVRPAGILNGITPTASAGTDLESITADIKAVLNPMYAANAGAKPVLLMHPSRALSLGFMTNATGNFIFRDELNQNRLMNVRVITSTNVPEDVIIALDGASLASAMGVPMWSVNDSTTLVMNDADTTPPTMAIDAAGAVGTENEVLPEGGIDVVPKQAVSAGLGVAGYYAESLFQTWCVAVRLILPVSYGVIRPGTIAAVNGIAW